MKTIINLNHDPYFNLALEEYLLKNFETEEDIFYLWQNDEAVVIGRNQNPFIEVNMKMISYDNIPVIRRISGGGAVYHDLGNINYTYIKKGLKNHLNNYRFFLDPIVEIMRKIAVDASFVEKSHIYIGDRKISGNAQSFFKDKVIHHGTLLFDTDLNRLKEVLENTKDYQTHSIKSNTAETTNIKEHLSILTTTNEFMEFILKNMFDEEYEKNVLSLSETDIQEINQLAEKKYKSWEWNYGETADFRIEGDFEGFGKMSVTITEGVIMDIKTENNIDLNRYLRGIRLTEETMKEALEGSGLPDIDDFIGKILY